MKVITLNELKNEEIQTPCQFIFAVYRNPDTYEQFVVASKIIIENGQAQPLLLSSEYIENVDAYHEMKLSLELIQSIDDFMERYKYWNDIWGQNMEKYEERKNHREQVSFPVIGTVAINVEYGGRLPVAPERI